MTYSRVKKYQELRDGLKEEVGISKEKYVETVQTEDDDDDFLSFMKKDDEEKEVNLEDTLTEPKTFEQMREEGSAELDKALKSAKETVGKQDEYNTRMDILNKIREPEKHTIKIDSVESYATEEFAKGMFVGNEVEEKPKEKMTFMEKLAAMSPEEDAKKAGAMALFGEKYGDIVRVVTVPGFSMELCGGSHVKNIGQIGMFKIIGESGVAAGVRRIEAITGKAAIDYMNNKAKLLQTAITTLKTNESNLCDKIANLLQENKEMKAEIAKVQAERAKADSNKLLMALKEYNGVNVIVGKIQAANMDELRNSADLLCNKFDKAGVVVLGAVLNDKVNFVVKANKDGVARGLHAGKIVKEVAMMAGGNGGGRPDMAQAGAKQPEKLNDAFAKAHEVIQSQIK